ncbi:BLUF domain-containing protein [Sulfitobacter sp.]|uniref:BLUF domain-containing protein n=1 Tax=Sulfitobacter sp. TaxID=1903071 RepID=UPI00300219F5
MHFLIYTSTASHLMDDSELENLLENCRMKNLKNDVTGMLLYKEGSFMQLLEGERNAVMSTYDRIEKDTRHKDITLLRERALPERNFGGWSMGFKSISSGVLEKTPGFSQLGENTFKSSELAADPHIALRLLKTFHETTLL